MIDWKHPSSEISEIQFLYIILDEFSSWTVRYVTVFLVAKFDGVCLGMSKPSSVEQGSPRTSVFVPTGDSSDVQTQQKKSQDWRLYKIHFIIDNFMVIDKNY